jgi:DNA invertase Pin-like site-specific DNA recombinase
MDHKELQRAGIEKARAAGKRWGGVDNTKRIGREEFVRRTKAGQQRARAEGKNVGRNLRSQKGIAKKVTADQTNEIIRLRGEGLSFEKIGVAVGLSKPTVRKVWAGLRST